MLVLHRLAKNLYFKVGSTGVFCVFEFLDILQKEKENHNGWIFHQRSIECLPGILCYSIQYHKTTITTGFI